MTDARPPLAGLTVLVPRARDQASGFSALLRARGAEPLEVPTIEIRPVASTAELDRAVEDLAAGRYDWVVLTSVNGVAAVRARAEALGQAFPTGRGAVLLARADLANPELGVLLRDKGWETNEVVAYHTVPVGALDPAARRRLDHGEVDWVAFTASSTVEGFLRGYGGPPPPGVRVAAIGPVTADTARSAGIQVATTAAEHTVGGLVAAIEHAVTT